MACRLVAAAFVVRSAFGSDPSCHTGVLSKDGTVCCASSCGSCAVPGCGGFPGGSDSCCRSHITRSCSDNSPPCLVSSQPTPTPSPDSRRRSPTPSPDSRRRSPTPGKKLGPDATWALLAWSEGTDTTSKATMVDVDLFDQHDKISDLKKAGHIVICYYSAGTAESWRSDVKADKAAWDEVIVGKMAHWGDEAWLDITQLSKLQQLMSKRIDMAQEYGCDGLEPDNTDCYDNGSDCYKKIKPSITHDQAKDYQNKYNEWTASYAHSKGMIVALKNTGDLVSKLHDKYDFAIVESCIHDGDCTPWADFHSDNKAIFGIEYKSLSSSDCDKATKAHIQMKYCSGKDNEECEEKATVHNCYKSITNKSTVIV